MVSEWGELGVDLVIRPEAGEDAALSKQLAVDSICKEENIYFFPR